MNAVKNRTMFSDIFCCPESKEPLVFEDNELISRSGRKWPIVGNIPRFVKSDLYTDSFSFEWSVHKETQVDFITGTAFSEDSLKQKTGLGETQVKGKLILDAGVGVGRYADVLSRWGANVVGVDLSYSVESAYMNLGDRPNVMIVQSDIGNLPFRPAMFDIIISLGVLHHTPDAKAYFNKLIPLLKPGGEICVWVYPATINYAKRVAWIPFTSRIPKKWFYDWCRWFVPFAHKRLNNIFVQFIGKIFPFSNQYLGIENDILDTFDAYSPKYHSIHSKEEVVSWFEDAGLTEIKTFSWETSVRGRKPVKLQQT